MLAIHEGVDEIEELIEDQVGGFVDRMLNERLLSVLSTKENVNLATLGFAEENVKKYQAIITPIDISGERLGTLFIYKSDAQYDIDDIILSEYGTTVVGLEMMRSVNEENAEETRKDPDCQISDQHPVLLRTGSDHPHFRRAGRQRGHSGSQQDRRQSGDYPFRYRQCTPQV